MICKQCQHRATKQTQGAGHFLLYGCRLKKLTFGTESDWKAGKWQGEGKAKEGISDMPTKCGSYEKGVL